MPNKRNTKCRHHIPKIMYTVRNWAEYDAARRCRGSLTLWVTAEAMDHWAAQARSAPALDGEDDIADALLKDLGVVRVEMLETLFEVFPLAKKIPLGKKQGKRVGVVTTTGGGAAMVVDQLGVRNVAVQSASSEIVTKLKAAGIPSSVGRVLDLTLAGTKYEVMKNALDILFNAPDFDMVLAVVGSSARFQPDLAVKPIIGSARHVKPLLAMRVPQAPKALAQLTAAEIPCFRTPEACADAIAAVRARVVLPGKRRLSRLLWTPSLCSFERG